MKICVTANGTGLAATVDSHFGRCKYFVMVDPDTMDSESVANGQGAASGGAGVQAAQQVISAGVDVLITGNVGPNAFSLLLSENVKMKNFQQGTVREAIGAYRSGSLADIDSANSNGRSSDKSGMQGKMQ